MLGINWKYIVILAVLAGVIYLVVSILTLGSVEAIEGNWAGYLVLILTWIGLIVISQIFQERLRVPDLPRYLILGMIIHLYLCLFYYLSELSDWIALSTLPILFISLYIWYNKEGVLNKFRIFAFYIPITSPGHPFAYDKEYKAYVYKDWKGYEALKYLEIRGGYDPIELLTIFYKANIELTLEIHYIKEKLNFYCGILVKDRAYERALDLCKKKFYELHNYLRTFGYEPIEIWDSYSMEKILEGPYLIWDPIEIPKIRKNPSTNDETVILESGIFRKKTSLFQLNSSILRLKQQPMTKISIQRSNNQNVKTEIMEFNKNESGLFRFLTRITGKTGDVDDFMFILRIHPYAKNELNKEQRRIKGNLTRLINNFKSDIYKDEAKFKMMQLNSVFGSIDNDKRKTGIMSLLYPDESKEFEKFWQELDNYQLGEEIGYWKISTYFVGKRYLANMLSTDCRAQILPMNVGNFPQIIRRKIFGEIESLDSKGLVNYLPFEPNLEGDDIINNESIDNKKVKEKDLF